MRQFLNLPLFLNLLHNCWGLYNEPFSISGAPTKSDTNSVSLEEVFRVGRYSAPFYCNKLFSENCDKWNLTLTHSVTVEKAGSIAKAIVGVLKGETEAVVAFTGAGGVQNFLLDSATVSPAGKFQIHLGMYTTTMSIFDEVVGQLQQYMLEYPEINRILVTGYSLGGAMASITVFNLNRLDALNQNLNYTLVTFGQPRVGNKEYAEYMNKLGISMARVVAKGDVIPHLPSTSVFGLNLGTTFHHHHQEIWVADAEMEKVKFCSMKVLEDLGCSNSLQHSYNIPDHLLYSKYYEIMDKKYGNKV